MDMGMDKDMIMDYGALPLPSPPSSPSLSLAENASSSIVILIYALPACEGARARVPTQRSHLQGTSQLFLAAFPCLSLAPFYTSIPSRGVGDAASLCELCVQYFLHSKAAC